MSKHQVAVLKVVSAQVVGAAHARRRVLAIADEREVTIVALDTGEVLSSHRVEPGKGYWRNQRRNPGRWPGSPKATQV